MLFCIFNFPFTVPSQAPSNFIVTVLSSTSITASWQLPPADSRHGIITGFRLLYKRKGSSGLPTTLHISKGTIFTKDVTGLDKYTKYEFQVLAFTSVGDGPRSSVVVERTKEDGKKLEVLVYICLVYNLFTFKCYYKLVEIKQLT